MVSAIIFAGHLVFVAYIFTKKWQQDSLSSAFTNLALVIILFTIGWSIATSVLKLFIDQKGFGIHFDSDTISLSLLSVAEFFFYRFYYKETPLESAEESVNR